MMAGWWKVIDAILRVIELLIVNQLKLTSHQIATNTVYANILRKPSIVIIKRSN
jgi:hypothetical protein